jgi:hypothetical protein
MAAPSSMAARVKALRAELDEHNYNYYVLDRPVITDADYDRLFRELEELEHEHPDLVSADSPTQRVGGAPLAEFAQVQHRTPMLSLANAFQDDEIAAFDKRVREALDADAIEYAAEPKFDGLAISLTYEGGNLVTAATRGDGHAALMVGAIYWNGDGVAKDDAAAAHWFEIADLAGETRAAKMLGDEAFGRLVKAAHPADTDAILDVAIGWYEKAVEVEPMPAAKAEAEQSLAMLSELKQKLSAR